MERIIEELTVTADKIRKLTRDIGCLKGFADEKKAELDGELARLKSFPLAIMQEVTFQAEGRPIKCFSIKLLRETTPVEAIESVLKVRLQKPKFQKGECSYVLEAGSPSFEEQNMSTLAQGRLTLPAKKAVAILSHLVKGFDEDPLRGSERAAILIATHDFKVEVYRGGPVTRRVPTVCLPIHSVDGKPCQGRMLDIYGRGTVIILNRPREHPKARPPTGKWKKALKE